MLKGRTRGGNFVGAPHIRVQRSSPVEIRFNLFRSVRRLHDNFTDVARQRVVAPAPTHLPPTFPARECAERVPGHLAALVLAPCDQIASRLRPGRLPLPRKPNAFQTGGDDGGGQRADPSRCPGT